MIDFGFAVFLALISAGVGLRVLMALDPGFRDTRSEVALIEALALATPLGLGLLALGVLAIGELGALNRLGVAVVLAVMMELGWGQTARLINGMVRGVGELGRFARSAARLDQLMLGLLAVLVIVTALASLKPVTDGDALCYHLQVPKFFLIQGGVGFEPDLHETIYPLGVEMLYAVGLECGGPVACRVIEWVLGMVLAAGTMALARPFLGARFWWAGVVVLAVPAVSNGMSAPLNDVALAASGVAAILAWVRFLDRPDPGRALLAGAAAGLAIGIKYPALILAAILGFGLLVRSLRLAGVGSCKWLLWAGLYALGVVALGGVWYLRSYVHTGNPVFPYFKEFFGGAGLAEVLDPIKRPLRPTIWNLLTALGPMTLEPDRFDSLAHEFGPIFLLFLPALLLVRAPRRLWLLLGVAYLFLIVALTQRQSMRFVLLALGPFAVGVAELVDRWGRRGGLPGRILVGIFVAVMGMQTVLAAVRARGAVAYLVGGESAARYLERVEPTFRVGRWTAAHLPADARLIGQDHRGFYFPRAYTMELAHRRRTGLGGSGETAGQIVDRLRKRGFTHLLLCPPADSRAVEFDPTLEGLLAGWLRWHEPVYHEELKDQDGVRRQYEIYDLASRRTENPRGVLR